MTDQPWIQFNKISKVFNKENKVGEINLSLKKGEIYALCGGNGAGKSTFIKVITGIMKATSGEIIVDGKVMSPKSMEYRRLFSYMPDHMLFPGQLTGEETLLFFAKLRNADGKKVQEMLKLVGLEEAKDRYIKYYSKGMQQRLSFAQALLADTPFIILDEPTNGLDPYWFYQFKEILVKEKEKGKTILFTTHVLSLVEEISDKVAFLEAGKVIKSGEVDSLMKQNGKKVSLEEVFFQHQLSDKAI